MKGRLPLAYPMISWALRQFEFQQEKGDTEGWSLRMSIHLRIKTVAKRKMISVLQASVRRLPTKQLSEEFMPGSWRQITVMRIRHISRKNFTLTFTDYNPKKNTNLSLPGSNSGKMGQLQLGAAIKLR